MIFPGPELDYEIHDVYVEETDDQLGVPALHLWALADEGDGPDELRQALRAALDELLVLASEVALQLRRQVDRLPTEDPDGCVHTAYEIELVQRFCEVVRVRPQGACAFVRLRLLPDSEGKGILLGDLFQTTRH